MELTMNHLVLVTLIISIIITVLNDYKNPIYLFLFGGSCIAALALDIGANGFRKEQIILLAYLIIICSPCGLLKTYRFNNQRGKNKEDNTWKN